jgi:hypothetical protein
MYSMGTLRFADQVLFLGQPGVFPEPPWVSERIHYLGALLREFQYGPGDRTRARSELGLPMDAVVIGVFPGSWREADTPLLETVESMFDALDAASKRLIWLAGPDYDEVRTRLGRRTDVLAIEQTWSIDQLMVACDAAITKSNRKAAIELACLKVPSIAVSWELNPADDTVVSTLPGVVRLSGEALTPEILGAAIYGLLSNPPAMTNDMHRCTPADCARFISGALDRAVLKSRRARGQSSG